MPFVIVGSPDCRRVRLFQEALAGLGTAQRQGAAVVLSYTDLLAGKLRLPEVVAPGAVVRIESPGKEFEVERRLLAEGAEAAEAEGCARLTRRAVEALQFERGRILPSRQWYLGFCRTLDRIERQLAECAPHRVMNRPAEIALQFDKPRCHERLLRAGIPVPRSLAPVRSHEELLDRMRRSGCPRVFVKLAHGSSASGVVAYQTSGGRHHATTTVEMVRENGTLRLFNSRRIQVYREPREIATLIDALCYHRVQVEEWLPKTGFEGRVCDLRVVVIDGRARHVVVRLSRSPMTNLHLLNARGDPEALRTRMGSAAWDEAMRTCEQVMASFPGSLYAGIDLLFSPGFRRHAVLEVNAFGDLLPGVLWEGMDTYAVEVRALECGSGSFGVRELAPALGEGACSRRLEIRHGHTKTVAASAEASCVVMSRNQPLLPTEAPINARDLIGTHDVLFVTLDALRYDVARDLLAAGRTPNLAHLLPDGQWEERHSPGNFTFAAHQAFFAGFLPTPAAPGRHGRLFAARFAGSETTTEATCVFDAPDIVTGLAQRGYHTVCIGGVGFFNRQTPLGCVLPELFAESHWSPALGVTDPHSTENQVRLAVGILERLPAERRVFLFVNISAVHQPNCLFLPGADRDTPASHAAALEYVDRHLPALFGAVQRRAPALVILCSDHGTAYGEDGYWGHRVSHPVVWTVPYAHFLLPRIAG